MILLKLCRLAVFVRKNLVQLWFFLIIMPKFKNILFKFDKLCKNEKCISQKSSYLLRQAAFLTRIAHKSAKEIPKYFACSGTKESAVIPGLVLISNKTTPSFSL